MVPKLTWLTIALLAVLISAETNEFGWDSHDGLAEHENANNTCLTGRCFEVDGHYDNFEYDVEYNRQLLEDDDDEFGEETRRELRGRRRRYISYGAMRANRVPCGRRGRSYYNCHARRANPYRRGCSVITHCYRYTG